MYCKIIENRVDANYDSLLILFYSLNFANEYLLGSVDQAKESVFKSLSLHNIYFGAKESYLLASIHNNIGVIERKLGNYDLALQNYLRALEIKTKIGIEDDDKIILSATNLSSLYIILGRYDEGLKVLNHYESLYPNINSPRTLVSLNLAKSRIYKNIRDKDKALQYTKNAKRIVLLNKSILSNEMVKVLLEEGNIYYSFNQYNEAISSFNLANSTIADNNINSQNDITKNLAMAHAAAGNNASADKYFKEIIKLSINNRVTNRDNFNNTYLLYSEFLNSIGKRKDAEFYVTHALDYSLRNYGPRSHNTAWCYEYLADVYAYSNIKKALRFYNDAIGILLNKEQPSALLSSSNSLNSFQTIELFRIVQKKSRALEERLKYDRSLQHLQEVQKHYAYLIDLIDKTKTLQLSNSSKMEITASHQKIYEKAVAYSLELYKATGSMAYAERAFNIAERSKASLLYQQIRESDARQFADIPDSLLAKEARLRRDIAAFQKLIYEERQLSQPDSLKMSNWEMRLLQLQTQQDQLTLSFERYFPEYYQYKYENRIYSMREIQYRLQPDEALIEYYISDSFLVGFCVTPMGVSIENQVLTTPLETLIAHLPNRQDLGQLVSAPREVFRDYVNSAYALYAILLHPFEALIQDRKLIIIPDGQLGYISFESLLSRASHTDRINYRDLHYVLRDHSVSYGYSAALLIKALERPKGHARGELLAFAPAVFNPDAPLALNASRFAERGGELMNLPQTLYEVAAIGKILKGKILMQEEATESRFKALASGYRILHIATHGLVNNDQPMYSRLAFFPEQGTDEDGYLNTYELFNMKLNAELAVLSACNTGYGQHVKGEGLMTLARGFMYSGVPSLVISLWKVEDRSTAAIMESFYAYLKEGLPKDEALRRAKLDYITQAGELAASPYFWSSFVNIGDTAPVSFRSPWQPIYLALGPAMAIFLISLFLLRRRWRIPGILM